MPTYWSPTAPGVQAPGGPSWFAVNITNIALRLHQLAVAMGGAQAQTGTLGAASQKLAASLVGVMHPKGTVAAQSKQLAATWAGAQTQTGAITSALPTKLSAALVAAQIQQGTFDGILAPLAAAMVGNQLQTGAVAAAAKQLVATFAASQTQSGTIASALSLPLSASMAAQEIEQGGLGATLSQASAASSGAQAQSGAIAAALQAASAALVAVEAPQGQIATTLFAPAAAALVGAQLPSGIIAATLQATTAAIAATDTVNAGTATLLLTQANATLAGAQEQSGSLTAALKQAVTTMAGIEKMDQTSNFNYSAAIATTEPAFWAAKAGTPTAAATQFTAPANRTDAIGTVWECATDSFRIDTVLGTRATGKSCIIIGADTTFNTWVMLEIETGTITNMFHIATQLAGSYNYNSGLYARRVDTSRAVVAAHTASIQYLSSTNTYSTYYDGTLVNSWIDTTNVMTHGAGHRFGGLIVDSEATTNKGVWWDSFRMYDL